MGVRWSVEIMKKGASERSGGQITPPNAYFHVSSHEIGHLDEMLSERRTHGAPPQPEHGYGGNVRPLFGGNGGSKRTGGGKTLPNAQFHGPRMKLGHDAEILRWE